MRTEVKIAAVIVIVLIGAGAIWYMGWGSKVRQTSPEETGQAPPETTKDDDRNFIVEETPDEAALADAGTSSDDATEDTSSSDGSDASATAEVGMAGSTDSAGPDLAGAAVSSDTSGADATGAETVTPAARPWWELSGRYPARVAPPDEAASSSASTGTSTVAPAATETTPPGRYLVKDGDSYWSIAKNLYGDGTQFKLLMEANPKIPPMSLRPGMTISTPPKPVATAAAPGSTPTKEPKTKHGTTVVDAASGTRYYIVKHGDNGFWGISQAVFGTGEHMGAIQKLNPNVNPKALQPGQKVTVPTEAPTLARRTSPTVSGTVGTVPRTTPRATASIVTGAPARAVLPSGEVFD